jgi:hypothetical protein
VAAIVTWSEHFKLKKIFPAIVTEVKHIRNCDIAGGGCYVLKFSVTTVV